jgi:hypothetical protein
MSAFRLGPPAFLVALAAGVVFAGDPPKPVVARVTPAADTTVATGPVDKDGFIDYETALNERMRGKITPNSNAVVLLFAAIGPKPEGAELHADFYTWLGTPPPALDGAYLTPAEKFFPEARGDTLEAFYEFYGELRKTPWTAQAQPRFAAWLAGNEKPLLAVTDAAERPDYYYPFVSRPRDDSPRLLIGALLSLVQKVRVLAPMLGARAMLRCGEKQYDAAWADLLAVHRLGRLMSKGASIIEMLVGIAIDAIARADTLAFLEHAPLTATQLAKCRADFEKLPPMAAAADKLGLSERFTYLDVMQSIRQYGFHPELQVIDLPTPNVDRKRVAAVLADLDWDRVLRRGNRWYDRFETALRKPTRAARLTALTDLEAELGTATDGTDLTALFKGYTAEKRAAASDAFALPLVQALLPAVRKVQEASDRHEQNRRTLAVAFALAAYRAEYDESPEKLADLVPRHLAAVPRDLYNGKPLVYKRTAAGYEVYSVGVNGTDDGGRLMTDTPRGDDLGVRLPATR